MKKTHALFALALILVATTLRAESISFGIFPYISASKLIKSHQPLAVYLSERIGVPVNIESASGFKPFIQRTRQLQYDLLMTAPHMGALAKMQSGYQPVAVARNKLTATFVVLKSSGIKSFQDLPSGVITLPPEKAVISKMALETLQQNGITTTQLQPRYTPSHDNAYKALLQGDSIVAAVSSPTYLRMPDAISKQLRVIGHSQAIPGNMFLMSPQQPPQRIQQVARLMLDFKDHPAGPAYFKKTRMEGFRAVTEQDLKILAPYVKSIFGYAPESAQRTDKPES